MNNYVRDKALLGVRTGKRGNVVKLYLKMFETLQFRCKVVLSGLTMHLEHGGFETYSGIYTLSRDGCTICEITCLDSLLPAESIGLGFLENSG